MSRHDELTENVELGDGEGGLDAVTGRVLAGLLRRSHLMQPGEMSSELAQAAAPLGVISAHVYLADLQQRQLVPLPAADDPRPAALPVSSTLAGRAGGSRWWTAPSGSA